MREIAQLVRRVPVMSSDKFLRQYKDVRFAIDKVL